jgi:FkbM family methyltransferase
MLSYFPGIKKIYALEPDKKNFKKLTRYSEADQQNRVIPINAAAWCEDTDGRFFGSGNRNSTAVATASFQHSEDSVRMLKIDSVTDENVDYVKYDVEGAEREAISGSRETILRCAPSLLISLYHRSRDIFELINFTRDNYPDYKLYLRRLRCLPAWEIDLICVK